MIASMLRPPAPRRVFHEYRAASIPGKAPVYTRCRRLRFRLPLAATGLHAMRILPSKRAAHRLASSTFLLALLLGSVARDAHAATPLGTVLVAQGLTLPLFAAAPPGDTTRLFVVEQREP